MKSSAFNVYNFGSLQRLTLAVKHMALEEAWSGHKPSVSHFRIFGCVVCVHVQQKNKA